MIIAQSRVHRGSIYKIRRRLKKKKEMKELTILPEQFATLKTQIVTVFQTRAIETFILRYSVE